MPLAQLAMCPYCQQGTLVSGYYCAFCGRMLRQPPQVGFIPGGQAYKPNIQGSAQSYQPYAVDTQGGGVKAIMCSYCQESNEPWLSTCKNCGRPLESTTKQ